MPAEPVPNLDVLVGELRELRLVGLLRLRRLNPDGLGRAARIQVGDSGPAAIETMLRSAVDRLGEGSLGESAAYTFGLTQGTRDWPGQDRRRRAAEVYGVSVDRFRKYQERFVVEQVAEQILQLCAEPMATHSAQSHTERASIGPGRQVALAFAISAGLDAEGSVSQVARIVVHSFPIELLTGVDVYVSPSNVYFEISRIFGDTVSASLRRAGAWRDAAGRVVDDAIRRELADWVDERGGPGTATRPGTIAATSAGALAEHGARRIYHAAVAVPEGAGMSYKVDEWAVAESVRGVFATASQERDSYDPPLASLCFPLLGAGRGGMPVDSSINVLWWALREELRRDPSWAVHIAVRDHQLAEQVVEHLLLEGARLADDAE
ncbi:MAG TPA: hypothetical protein VGM10_11105 [Actinocrinis sp.]|jgi:O-acetyl-ADP-ribose deacetylase (regulator of RNase III)